MNLTGSPETAAHPSLQGLTVFQRGWLSSNNVLVPAGDHDPGATLIDSSHVNHAPQTVALLRHALGAAPLARVVNTHLHSDHCGGNAAVQRAFGAEIHIPPGQAVAVRDWDGAALSYEATGQRIERFEAQALLEPGAVLEAGGRRFEVLAAPGHDPHSVMLFDAANGLLLSADALWEHGFGVVFPEVEGEPGFDDVARVLDLIERLPVRLVVPGHGAPFTDVAGALARSRARLAGFVASPDRHARHAAKVLIKYHMMEEGRMPRDELLQWAADTPLMAGLWARWGRAHSGSALQWAEGFVAELVRSGVLGEDGDAFVDA